MILVSLNSCTTETGCINETVILNNSSCSISFAAYAFHDTTIMLDDGEQVKEVREGDTGSAEVFPIESDSIIIVFNDTHVAKYFNTHISGVPNDTTGPLSLNSYEMEYLGEEGNYIRNRFIYTITEEDYNNAIPIEEAGE